MVHELTALQGAEARRRQCEHIAAQARVREAAKCAPALCPQALDAARALGLCERRPAIVEHAFEHRRATQGMEPVGLRFGRGGAQRRQTCGQQRARHRRA
jgi:hypothetical protein